LPYEKRKVFYSASPVPEEEKDDRNGFFWGKKAGPKSRSNLSLLRTTMQGNFVFCFCPFQNKVMAGTTTIGLPGCGEGFEQLPGGNTLSTTGSNVTRDAKKIRPTCPDHSKDKRLRKHLLLTSAKESFGWRLRMANSPLVSKKTIRDQDLFAERLLG